MCSYPTLSIRISHLRSRPRDRDQPRAPTCRAGNLRSTSSLAGMYCGGGSRSFFGPAAPCEPRADGSAPRRPPPAVPQRLHAGSMQAPRTANPFDSTKRPCDGRPSGGAPSTASPSDRAARRPSARACRARVRLAAIRHRARRPANPPVSVETGRLGRWPADRLRQPGDA